MITWMQRHKKWLIVTIWISTIAFVGAGAVGWGSADLSPKAGLVAEVGNVEITQGDLQKSYSRLYTKYNKMFQGNFDEEKAKQFGLQKQALQELIQQALLLNLAQSYDLEISSKELIAALKTQEYFFKDGVFNKEIYKQALSQNRLSSKEYEADLSKDLLIQKTFSLLPVKATKDEELILSTLLNIADKISYKVLDSKDIQVDMSDAKVKAFWELQAQNYMSEVSYDVKYLTQASVTAEYDEAKISAHYSDNRTHFKGQDGKILPLSQAKESVIAELNAKATKDKALRTYIAFKKGKLNDTTAFKTASVSNSKNPFSPEVVQSISKLSLTSPYMKPILVNDTYYTFELIKINPSAMKSYEDAKAEVLPSYTIQTKQSELLTLANSSVATFSGEVTDFITAQDVSKLTKLDAQEAAEFLSKLFTNDKKRSFVQLNNGKIVLFNILEQKLLTKDNSDQGNVIAKLKGDMFNEALMSKLQNIYPTEIFIQGL